MEMEMITEFVTRTGAKPNDALICLKTWGWDLKKALIDYNDTSTTEYFNNKKITTNKENYYCLPMEAVSSSSMSTLTSSSSGQTSSHTTISADISSKKTQSEPSIRPNLVKCDSIDVADCKKLSRGISRATDNINLVSRARNELAMMDFHINIKENIENLLFIDKSDYTFILPNLNIYSDDYRRFLEKDLIECSTLNSLEEAKRLNWWTKIGICRKLWPLATTGDGNCLLHAASLGMWGFHDRKLTLRSALHSLLSSGEYPDSIWRRWRFQQTRLNKQAGFVYSENEWAKEWEEIVAMASPEPRQSIKGCSRRRSVVLEKNNDSIDDNATYESLEEVHVLALAHVLRRTIIVVADTVLRDMNGEAMAPIPFGGVYMPFEISPNDCHRSPLLLTYDMAHFSALVAMEESCDQPPALIPLIDCENVFLPIQFSIDPGPNFLWRNYDGDESIWKLTDREHIVLLKEYLNIIFAGIPGSPEDDIYDNIDDEEFDKKINDAEIILASTLDDQLQLQYQQQLQQLHNENQTSNGCIGNSNKSKAAKQLQSVAKQFGSIGKSMSKKIKKNIGSITKIGTNKNANHSINKKDSLVSLNDHNPMNSMPRTRTLCAQLKLKRHHYQDEMIHNYLECAQHRYISSLKTANYNINNLLQTNISDNVNLYIDKDNIITPIASSIEPSDINSPPSADKYCMNKYLYHGNDESDGSKCDPNCINANCSNYGKSSQSYMCDECFENQKLQEDKYNNKCSNPIVNINNKVLINEYIESSAPRYGTGKSKFYTQTDMESHNVIKRLPSVRRLNELDQTLYLSNSTFYNDKLAPQQQQQLKLQQHNQQSYNSQHNIDATYKMNYSPSENYLLNNHNDNNLINIDNDNIIFDDNNKNVMDNNLDRISNKDNNLIDLNISAKNVNTNINIRKKKFNDTKNIIATSGITNSPQLTVEYITLGIPIINSDKETTVLSSQRKSGSNFKNEEILLSKKNLYNNGNYTGNNDIFYNNKTNNDADENNDNDNDDDDVMDNLMAEENHQRYIDDIYGNGVNNYNDLNRQYTYNKPGTTTAVSSPFLKMQAQKCRTTGCMFYGSFNSNFYCSKCCQIQQEQQQLSQQQQQITSSTKLLTDV